MARTDSCHRRESPACSFARTLQMCHARERASELFEWDFMWCGNGLCELLLITRVVHGRLVERFICDQREPR
jgi:hypothetical protein